MIIQNQKNGLLWDDAMEARFNHGYIHSGPFREKALMRYQDDLLSKDKKTISKSEEVKKEVKKTTGAKMGRPKKSIKADERIVCYLTKEENEKFELLAEEEVISKSALARKILIQFLKSK